jgi:hypothetical protein
MKQSLLLLPFLVGGCSDYGVNSLPESFFETYDSGDVETYEENDDCVEASTAFDIEEVSALQDAFGLPKVRDGLSLNLKGKKSADQRWRPTAVEVLVMYPDWFFEYYDDSNSLGVNFYASENPTSSKAFSKTIKIKKKALEWEPLRLPADADWSGQDRDQMAAWLRFDLSDVVPEEGFVGADYFVSLNWDSMGFPNVGYSNFELDCTQNWTDYGTGNYTQNTGEDCSWPMLKIEIETLSPGDCD